MGYPKPDLEFLEHLKAGRFMIQRSRSSGRHVFHPRVAEPVTGAADLEWVPASGRGVVHAVTVISQRPPKAGYNVVLVDLAEGVRMMSRVEGVPNEDLRIGQHVTARIEAPDEGDPFVVFGPAEDI